MPRRATATATSTSRRVQCGTLAVLLVLLQAAPPLVLLLAGGPAGAAAQALPPVGPPAPLAAAPREASAPEAEGKAKKLAKCAIVRVFSGKTCKVKNGGKTLLVKVPAVLVLKDGAEEAAELGPKQFAKQYAKTYASGAGPTANVTFAGQPVVAAALDGMAFQKPKSGTSKLKGKVAPSDRGALAALDPAAGPCVLEFRTPCGEDGEDGEDGDVSCTYGDTQCAAGAICPGGTAVSARCANRSRFGENPCACTALQQMAALSPSVQTEAPWNDLANTAYCQGYGLYVDCAPVDGVQLPTFVVGEDQGLAGALRPSLGELGPSLTDLVLNNNAITSLPTELGALTGLTRLFLQDNAITSVPTEIAALTGLVDLDLSDNLLTGVPAEFRTVDPSDTCVLFDNRPGFSPAGFSCANVGAETSCCTGDFFGLGNQCGEGLSGGPCYAG